MLGSGELSERVQEREDLPAVEVRRLQPGTVFGDLASVFNGIRGASVVAEGPVVLYAIPHQLVSSLYDGNGDQYLRQVFDQHSTAVINGVKFMTPDDFISGLKATASAEVRLHSDDPADDSIKTRRDAIKAAIPTAGKVLKGLEKRREKKLRRNRLLELMLTLLDRDQTKLIRCRTQL